MGIFKLLNTLKNVLSESYRTDSVTMSFRKATPWKSPKTGKWYVFFDGVEITDGEFNKSNQQNLYLGNGKEEFELYSSDVQFDKSKKKLSLPMDIFAETNPKGAKFLFTAQQPIDIKVEPSDIKPYDQVMKPYLIRRALELAFPEYWNKQDDEFSAGLRGIHTIGEKLGNDETWSVMNYFDTKKEVQKMLYDKFISEGGGDLTKWLVDTFKKNDDFVQKLVDRQWSSIGNGLKREQKVLDKFIEQSGSDNFVTFPAGSIMDRHQGIDVIIDGKSFQIKPLSGGKRNFDGTTKSYTIYTYGMRDYKGKPVEYMAYVNEKGDYAIFKNDNYTVKSSSEVEHFGPPQKPF